MDGTLREAWRPRAVDAMQEEPSVSDLPQEGAFVGEPRPEDSTPAVDERSSPPARDRGKVVGIGAMGALVAVGIGLIVAAPKKAEPPAPALALTSGEVASEPAAREAAVGAADAAPSAAPAPPERPPPVWRVAALKDDPDMVVAEGTFGRRGLVGALSRAGLARPEIKRVAQAFEGTRRIDRPRDKDAFVFAKDKSRGALVAFEYATSPVDVWQARVDDASADGRVVVKKLELFVEHRRVASALVISGDLAKAIEAAGMRPEIVDAVDDALAAHVDPGAIRTGVRMRVVATEDWVEGAFSAVKVEAIEFVPTSGAPLRVYFYERDPSAVAGSARRAPLPGFYDAKGRQPYRGQFRSPLALARVTSRFDPKRVHPVLKVVRPHNGVDFRGAPGTPVYASGAGTVVAAGNGGACGNMVQIDHGGGIRTIYCHLKAFAQGLRSGQKVEAHQQIGFVGQTGRVTGPHLHFAVKRNGAFIDPLALKMDGVRVLPPADRDAFARRRAELDAVIDGVALPSAADVPDEGDEPDLHEAE